MKYLSCLFLVMALVASTGCSSMVASVMGPDVESSDVYIAANKKPMPGKVLVMPVVIENGSSFIKENKKSDYHVLDAAFLKVYHDRFEGSEIVPIPRVLVNKTKKGWKTIGKVAKGMDKASDGVYQDSLVAEVMKIIMDEVGVGSIAIAVINQDDGQFKSSRKMTGKVGLLDTETLTWNWVTTLDHKHNKLAAQEEAYAIALHAFVDDSIDLLEEHQEERLAKAE